MKNKLTDLNDHLFAQMERLGDEDLKPEDIQNEVNRTNALVKVSDQIIQNAALSLKALVVSSELGDVGTQKLPPMIELYKDERYKDHGKVD